MCEKNTEKTERLRKLNRSPLIFADCLEMGREKAYIHTSDPDKKELRSVPSVDVLFDGFSCKDL